MRYYGRYFIILPASFFTNRGANWFICVNVNYFHPQNCKLYLTFYIFVTVSKLIKQTPKIYESNKTNH